MLKPTHAAVGPAFALLICVTACGAESLNDAEPANEPGAGEYVEETAAAAGEALEDAGEVVVEGAENAAEAVSAMVDKELEQLNAFGLTARNILDEEVRTRAGTVAARIDDILFTPNGKPAIAVLGEGGMLGVGEDEIIVTIQRLVMMQDAAGEVSVEVTISDEELEALGDGIAFLPADFSVAGQIDTTLLSARKLLETKIYNTEDQKVADIYDLVLDREWAIKRIVVSTGGIADLGDRLVEADWEIFIFTEDNSALRTTDEAVNFDALPEFRYEELVGK